MLRKNTFAVVSHTSKRAFDVSRSCGLDIVIRDVTNALRHARCEVLTMHSDANQTFGRRAVTFDCLHLLSELMETGLRHLYVMHTSLL